MLQERAAKALARPILHDAICILYALEPHADAEQADRISALRRGLAELQDSIWGNNSITEIHHGINHRDREHKA